MVELKDFTLVPIEDAIKPRTGAFPYVNFYWVVTKDNEILFYNRMRHKRSNGSPQCNKDKRVGDMMIKKYGIEGLRNELIPLVFVDGRF